MSTVSGDAASGDVAPIADGELAEIERRADGGDVARLVAEVRRLTRLATARGDEVLRLSRALDELPQSRSSGRTA